MQAPRNQEAKCILAKRNGESVSPVQLYVGSVMHARLKPFVHRFTYSVFNILIDIDQLAQASQKSSLFAVNKFAPVSFYEKDHGDEHATGLSNYIRHCLSNAGLEESPDRIQLLCYPRIFGYVFNPISIYFCSKNGKLIAMIYEVRNTFRGKHIYVEPVQNGQLSSAGLKQECDKLLHVSPFIEMKMRYFFRTQMPEEQISFRILENDQQGPLLSAALKAKRHDFTSTSLAMQLIKKPFLTFKVVFAIHFEAMKLWFKGAKFYQNPHKSPH
ncbi:MAG: DUF1365 domain-containing protein [Hyphomicrobiales bacterium]